MSLPLPSVMVRVWIAEAVTTEEPEVSSEPLIVTLPAAS